MLQKPAPDATGDVDYRLLVPVLVNSTLIHTVVSILRVTTSYRAVELDLSIVWLGVISATFAIFPIFLAVWVGRFIDRGNDAVTAWIGSGLIAVAAAGFAAFSSALALLVFTAVLGTGHLFMMAAQQMLCVRSGGPAAWTGCSATTWWRRRSARVSGRSSSAGRVAPQPCRRRDAC